MKKSLKFHLILLLFLISLSLMTPQNQAGALIRPNPKSSSPTFKSRAFIAYRSSTGTSINYPKNREWGASLTWGSENEMADAGSPVRWARVAYCTNTTRFYEKIVVTLSDDNNLDAYVWNGTGWDVTNNIGTVSSAAGRPYDIAYETYSGRALLVYDVAIGDAAKDLGFKIWDGSSWGSEQYIDVTGVVSTNPVVSFLVLASNPDSSSNQIAMAFNEDTDDDAFASIWSGSAWGKHTTITTTNTNANMESIGVQYATYSKDILAVAGNDKNSLAWSTYDQGTASWTAQTAFDPDKDAGNHVCFLTLKADPAATASSDLIMFAGVNSGLDLNLILFNATTAWTHDGAVGDTNDWGEFDDALDTSTARCVDFDWEQTGSKGLVVWGTTAGEINYNTFTAPSTWGAVWTTKATMGTNIHPWVQLRRNPRNVAGDVKILGAVLEDTAFDLGAIKWDGTTFTVVGASTFTADTTVSTYECFELEFMLHIPTCATVYVYPASVSTNVTFSVEVRIKDAFELYGWEFKLNHTHTILTPTTVSIGNISNFLDKKVGAANTFESCIEKSDSAPAGRVWATQTITGVRPGADGFGTLANITYSPDAAGNSPLDLHDVWLVGYNYTGDRTTYNITAICVNVVDGSVTVTLPVVPEFPLGAAMEIALAAVIIYIWWRKKIRIKTAPVPK